MAEPYVPIAEYAPYNSLMNALKTDTDAAQVNINAVQTAKNNAQTSNTTAQTALSRIGNPFLLGGA